MFLVSLRNTKTIDPHCLISHIFLLVEIFATSVLFMLFLFILAGLIEQVPQSNL